MKPSVAALRFALGGLGGVLGWLLVIVGHATGPLALLLPTLAFFGAGSVAANGFALGPLATWGFGVLLACGGMGSFLAVLGLQGATGKASPLVLTAIIVGWFVLSFGGAAAVGLMPTLKYGRRVYVAGVAGCTAGAALGGLLVSLVHLATRDSGLVAPFWIAAAIALLIPGVACGVVVARALTPADKS